MFVPLSLFLKQPPSNAGGGTSDNFDDRRKSHGGDSKYGFGNSNNNYDHDPYSTHQQNGGSGAGQNNGSSPQLSSMPPSFSPNRNNGAPLSLPPSTHSPHQQRNSMPPPPGRNPTYSSGYGGNHPQINGHSSGTDKAPEIPPKIDRTSKPGRVRSGHDFGSGKDLENDNYINTGRGSSLERQNKVSFYHMNFI